MRKDEASKLINRFLSAHREGKEPYFDADEIDRLLDSLEEADDWTYYEEIVRLGKKLHPAHTELKLRECKYHIFRQEYAEALELMDSFSDVWNQDLDMLRIECYCNLRRHKKVTGYLQKLIDNQCEHVEVIFEHAVAVLNDLDMNQEARTLIAWGLKLYPDNLILKDELCYILEAEGEFPEAIRLCNELIDKDPFSYETWFTLGRLYSMTGDFEKAIEAFDYALACDESDLELKILKSYCLFMNENYEKAIASYWDIASDDETKERIKPLIAECYIKLKQYEECYDILKEKIYHPDDESEPISFINYIRCCLETGRKDEAAVILHKAIELFPDDVRILSLVALNHIENGEEQQALKITEKIFTRLEIEEEMAIEDLKDFFNSSLHLYFSGNLRKAYQYYKKVFQFKPELPFMHIQRAIACFNMGDTELFSKYYFKAGVKELTEYIKMTGVEEEYHTYRSKHIAPDKLSYEYLHNKDNNN